MDSSIKRPLRSFLLLLLTIMLLLGTHMGEFWPFSIYPMFSKAGKPWQRAIIVKMQEPDQSNTFVSTKWDTLHALNKLESSVIALEPYRIAQNDFANFLHKVPIWDLDKQKALFDMFIHVEHDSLMIYKVRGHLDKNGTIAYEFIPMMFIQEGNWSMNPSLKQVESVIE